ncbi:Arsenite methyltransferase [Tritrichomonas musculus]|uniref:Arsenite methyltransferase n=1 Tax=Tritrichomonas musculus TaxID=1915356 RepID=A0ABR2H6Z2_9EUKA
MTDEYHQDISNYYGKEIQHTSDLKFSCCVSSGTKHVWHREILSKISPEVLDKYYGCGSPIPDALEGRVIIDLGSGTGRDCFLAAVLSGKKGHVIGVDMTDEQLEVANRSISYHHQTFPDSSSVEFKKGMIEDLKSVGINDNSVDIVISNCVINLSNDKERVFKEIFRVLKDGGEVHISDIFTNIPVGQKARENKMLVGECMGNAIDLDTFVNVMKKAGFSHIYAVEARYVPTPGVPADIIDPAVNFFSVTFSAFKMASIEKVENQWNGDWVKYLGGIDHCDDELEFDLFHKFRKSEKVFVGSLLAETLKKSRYGQYFEFGRDTGSEVPPKPEEKTFIQTVLDTKKDDQNGSNANQGTGGCCSSSCCCCCNNNFNNFEYGDWS